jgi:3'-5' exoribonuclease
LILSHHGELEYGSPKVPLFPEALLLHHLDNLDSKMEAMRAQIDRDRLVEGVWTGYNSALGRSALKKRKFLEPVEPAAAATPAASGSAASPAASPVHSAVPPTAPASAAVPSAKSEFASKLRNAIKDAG